MAVSRCVVRTGCQSTYRPATQCEAATTCTTNCEEAANEWSLLQLPHKQSSSSGPVRISINEACVCVHVVMQKVEKTTYTSFAIRDMIV